MIPEGLRKHKRDRLVGYQLGGLLSVFCQVLFRREAMYSAMMGS